MPNCQRQHQTSPHPAGAVDLEAGSAFEPCEDAILFPGCATPHTNTVLGIMNPTESQFLNDTNNSVWGNEARTEYTAICFFLNG